MGATFLSLCLTALLIVSSLQPSTVRAKEEKKEEEETTPDNKEVDTRNGSQTPLKPPPLPKDPRYLAVVYAALDDIKAKSPAVWERIKSSLPDWFKVPEVITNLFKKFGWSWGRKPEPVVSSENGPANQKSKEGDKRKHKEECDDQAIPLASYDSTQHIEGPASMDNSAQPPAKEPSSPAKEPPPPTIELSPPSKEPPPLAKEPKPPANEPPPPAYEPLPPAKEPLPPTYELSPPDKEPPPPAKETSKPPNDPSPPASKPSPPDYYPTSPGASSPPKSSGGFHLSSNWYTAPPANYQSPPPPPAPPISYDSHDFSSYSLSSFDTPPYDSSAYEDYKRASEYLKYLKEAVNEP